MAKARVTKESFCHVGDKTGEDKEGRQGRASEGQKARADMAEVL